MQATWCAATYGELWGLSVAMHGGKMTLPSHVGREFGRESEPCTTPKLTLDLVVISAGDKERLRLVEMHPTDWAIVLIKAINESAHAIVP